MVSYFTSSVIFSLAEGECKYSLVYIIAWSAVLLGINSTSNVGSNFHEAKPS